MKVINVHTRVVQQPKWIVAMLFKTLSSENDMVLATDKWPRMKLDKGLQVGSKGGHGVIKYFVSEYFPDDHIKFQFTLKGFIGFHEFRLAEIDADNTKITHTIIMRTKGNATLKWILVIQYLHNAFIEDALNNIENHFLVERKVLKWNWWVRFLRRGMHVEKHILKRPTVLNILTQRIESILVLLVKTLAKILVLILNIMNE